MIGCLTEVFKCFDISAECYIFQSERSKCNSRSKFKGCDMLEKSAYHDRCLNIN